MVLFLKRSPSKLREMVSCDVLDVVYHRSKVLLFVVPKSSSYLNDDTEESDSEKATPAKSRQTYHRDARERSGQQLTSSNRQSSRSDSEDELEKERGDGRRRDRVRGIVAAKPSHIPEGLSASETDEVKETLGVSRKPLKSVANVSVTPAANRSAYKRPETSLDRYKSDTNTGEMSVHVNRFSSSASTPMQVAAYSSNSQLDTSAAKPVERVRPHRDVTYNPSKADFEKARQLLARTGRNR